MNGKAAKNAVISELIKEALFENVSSQKELQALKNRYSREYNFSSPSNVDLIKAYRSLIKNKEISKNESFFNLIKKRKIRSQSGIANITVLTKKYDCPGNCIFCPQEPDMPKSYLSNEPAMMRAVLNDFDPYRQVENRLKGLTNTGHPTDKIEIIISGGTFSYYPKNYQTYFVRNVYNALNCKKSASIADAIKLNESAKHRCVGLSVETRPDWINKSEIKRMRKLGVTKVEIGIQTLDDEILKLNRRGHTVYETKKAMKMLKDAGFKINAHMMPNLYGSNKQKDLYNFKKLFSDSSFRPDWLKIYPCVVTPYSELEKMWKKGMHKAYTDEELIDLLIKMKKHVPEYVRIARLYRDIPAESILGGSKLSNLRQYILRKMNEEGERCRCIRCREIRDEKVEPDNIKLKELVYDSSGGKEHFLSFTDTKKDKLLSFLRLRIPSQIFNDKTHYINDLNGASVIRELHTYGTHLELSAKSSSAAQHKGYGKRLIEKAEEITKNYGLKKMAVISGIGVREYYKKRGFELSDTYMVKNI